jgi:hypothetical protein
LTFKRLLYIQDTVDFETTPAPLRLLYLKELYTIFAELKTIKFTKKLKKPDGDLSYIRFLLDLEKTVVFVRHVLSHFPLFNTWDEIWMSRDFAVAMNRNSEGTISRYLTYDAKRVDMAWQLKIENVDELQTFGIYYPKDAESHERIYLKDILAEKVGALSVIRLLNHFF